MFLARIYVNLKETVNDPQGLTVLGSLRHLGFPTVSDVRVGKYLQVRIDEPDIASAHAKITEMCQQLLANPVIEEFNFVLEEETPLTSPSAAGPTGIP